MASAFTPAPKKIGPSSRPDHYGRVPGDNNRKEPQEIKLPKRIPVPLNYDRS